MTANNMPKTLNVYTPAGAEMELVKLSNPVIVDSWNGSVPTILYRAAIGYALEMLATDDDGNMIEAGYVYEGCMIQSGSLTLNDFEGYEFIGDDDLAYNIRRVCFFEMNDGLACALDIWNGIEHALYR